MVAGPEIARMVSEFELLQAQTSSNGQKHHEQHRAVPLSFVEEVKSLVGNPLWSKVKTFWCYMLEISLTSLLEKR